MIYDSWWWFWMTMVMMIDWVMVIWYDMLMINGWWLMKNNDWWLMVDDWILWCKLQPVVNCKTVVLLVAQEYHTKPLEAGCFSISDPSVVIRTWPRFLGWADHVGWLGHWPTGGWYWYLSVKYGSEIKITSNWWSNHIIINRFIAKLT